MDLHEQLFEGNRCELKAKNTDALMNTTFSMLRQRYPKIDAVR